MGDINKKIPNGKLFIFFLGVFLLLSVQISWATGFKPFLLSDVWGNGSSTPENLTAVNDKLFFTAADGVFGKELYVSDGTVAGTRIAKGGFVFTPSALSAVGNKLLFRMGSDLWSSDGTEAGTQEIIDFQKPLSDIVMLGSNGVFLAKHTSSSNTVEVWSTDGTVGGTVKIKTINNSLSFVGSPYPNRILTTGSQVFFVINEIVNGQELWVTDGSEVGTHIVKDIRLGTSSSEPRDLVNANGTLFFSARDGTNGRKLWKSDGTEAGTVIVRAPSLDGGNSPEKLFSDGTTVYFSAVDNDGLDREPWVSDGTSVGTVKLKDIGVYPSSLISSFPENFQKIGSHVFFSTSQGLFKTDGTTAGTVAAGLPISVPFPVEEFDGHYYFAADTVDEGTEPAYTDGTALGTGLLFDINEGSDDSSPTNFTAIGDTLFFSADDGQVGKELWALQNSNRVINLNQVAAKDDSITIEADFNTNFGVVNYYAICHTAGSLILPTAHDIKNGTIDGSIAALSSVSVLSYDTNASSPASFICDLLPNSATEYDIYVVFEDAANVGEFSDIFSATTLKMRTAPQVETLTFLSSNRYSAEFSAQISLASETDGLRVHYVCDESEITPTAEEVIAGKISGGVDGKYGSSKTISSYSIGSSTNINDNLTCYSLDSGTTYHVYAVVEDIGFSGDGYDGTPISLSFITQGEIGDYDLVSSSESSIEFSLSQFRTTFDSINIYAVCYEGELTDFPSVDDIKAGRINTLTQANGVAQNLGVTPSVSQTVKCTALNPSANHEVYVVFENADSPNSFSAVTRINNNNLRTAPEISSIISTESRSSSVDVVLTLNQIAQTSGSRVYWVCDDSVLVPSAENIIVGRISNGIVADSFGSQNVNADISGSTEVTVACNNLSSGDNYYFYAVAEDNSFRYASLAGHQVQPITTSLLTTSKIDSITQTGMTESKIDFEIDSISTVFDTINAYIICVENGETVTPTAQDIKAGRMDPVNFATASGQLIEITSAQSSFSLSCSSGAMAPAKLYDVYSVFENAESPGEFSEVFLDTLSEWRTAPVLSGLETEVNGNSILVKVKVQSAASSTNIRLHMVCDEAEQLPSSENITMGLIDTATAASVVETLDLNAFTNQQSDQQHIFSCAPSDSSGLYHMFMIAEDLAFIGKSYQIDPISTMGELEIDQFCIPIKIKSTNSVVLICL